MSTPANNLQPYWVETSQGEWEVNDNFRFVNEEGVEMDDLSFINLPELGESVPIMSVGNSPNQITVNASESNDDDDSMLNLIQMNGSMHLFDAGNHYMVVTEVTEDVVMPSVSAIRHCLLCFLSCSENEDFVFHWEQVGEDKLLDAACYLPALLVTCHFRGVFLVSEVLWSTSLYLKNTDLLIDRHGIQVFFNRDNKSVVVAVHNDGDVSHYYVKLKLVGIELNPGPSSSEGGDERKIKIQCILNRKAASLKDKRAKFNYHHGRLALAQAIAEDVKVQVAQSQAAQDVQAEKVAEEAQKLLDEHDQRICSRVKDDPNLCYLRCIDFEVVSMSKDFEPQVGLLPDFTPRILPIKVLRCTLSDVKVERSSHQLSFSCAPIKSKFSITLLYTTKYYNMGFGGKCVAIEDGPVCRLSMDLLKFFQHKQLGCSASYCTILDRLESFIPSHLDFNHDDLDTGWFTPTANRLFVALIVREHILDATWEALIRGIRSDFDNSFGTFSDYAKFAPVESGTYVQGYKCGLVNLFPDQIPEMINGAIDGVVQAGTMVRLSVNKSMEKLEKQSNTFCRLCEGCHIKSFIPCFPDPILRSNIRAGVVKRLIRVMPNNSTLGNAYYAAIGGVIAESVSNGDAAFDRASVMSEGRSRCDCMPWSDEEKGAYMLGVDRVCCCAEGVQFTKDELDEISFGWFIKNETYPAASLKAVRIIVCPEHYSRGILWALLHKSEERIKFVLGDHLVKGMNREQVMTRLVNVFEDSRCIIEGDTTSFERHVNRDRQLCCECPIYTSAAPRVISQAVSDMMAHLATTKPYLVSGLGVILTDVMRMSGTQQTSIGNAVENICMWFSMLCEANDVSVADAAGFYKNYPHPYLVEGDDILIAVDHKLDVGVKFHEVARRQGNDLKADFFENFIDANFCGNTLEITPEGVFRVKEPLEALSRVFARLGVYGCDAKRDMEFLVAKARSYLIDFPGVPILSEICHDIVNKFGDADEKLRRQLRLYFEKGVILTGYARTFYQQHAYRLEDLRHYACGASADFIEIPMQMRIRIANQFGLSLPFQYQVVKEFREGLSRGDKVIDVPTLTNYWLSLPGPSSMTVRVLEGARLKAVESVKRASNDLMSVASNKIIKVVGIKDAIMPIISLGVNVLSVLLFCLSIMMPIVMLSTFAIALFLGFIVLSLLRLCGIPTKWLARLLVAGFGLYSFMTFYPLIRMVSRYYRKNCSKPNNVSGLSTSDSAESSDQNHMVKHESLFDRINPVKAWRSMMTV